MRFEPIQYQFRFVLRCTDEDSSADTFGLDLYTVSDSNVETKVYETSASCEYGQLKRLGYEPFVVDGTFAHLRYVFIKYAS